MKLYFFLGQINLDSLIITLYLVIPSSLAVLIGVKIINMTYEKQDPFFNINTKEDLEIAEKILND